MSHQPTSLEAQLQTMLINASNAADSQYEMAKTYSKLCDKMADRLAECVGLLLTIENASRFHDVNGNLWINRTAEWCDLTKEVAEKAGAAIKEHDTTADAKSPFRPWGKK